MCSLDHDKFYHDCRLNFHGSSKAMETDVVATITRKSIPMEETNVKIGIFIDDEDLYCCFEISKLSRCCETVRQKSCKMLFQQSVIIAYLQHAELTKNSYQTIKYIKKCFVYVI